MSVAIDNTIATKCLPSDDDSPPLGDENDMENALRLGSSKGLKSSSCGDPGRRSASCVEVLWISPNGDRVVPGPAMA